MSQQPSINLELFPEPYRTHLSDIGLDSPAWGDLELQEKTRRLGSLVGDTALSTVTFDDRPGSIIIKREMDNGLSGSHYDRLLPMFAELLREEVLRPGDTIIDVSSGSYGNAKAVMSAAYGMHSVDYIPLESAGRRTALARAAGASLIIEPEGYVPAASEHMNRDRHRLARERGTDGKPAWHRDRQSFQRYRMDVFTHRQTNERRVYLNHSANPKTVEHMSSLATELVGQLDGTVDPRKLVFGFAVGNFATIVASVLILRQAFPTCRVYGFEGTDSSPCFDDFYMIPEDLRHYDTPTLLGTSAAGTTVEFTDLGLLNGIATVTDRQWQLAQRQLAEHDTPLRAGRTTAAAVALGTSILGNRNDPDTAYVCIGYDDASKYDQDAALA